MKRSLYAFLCVTTAVAGLICTPVPVVQAQGTTLYFPALASQPNLLMGIALVNNDPTTSANVEFTARNDLGALISGEGIQNPVRRTLAPGEQFAEVVTETFGAGFTNASGWIQVTSDNARTRGFFLVFDPALNIMDGADVGSLAPVAAVLPEISSATLSAVNLQTGDSVVQMRLRSAGGAVRETISRAIPALGRLFQPAASLFATPIARDDYITMATMPPGPMIPFTFLGTGLRFIAGLNGQTTESGATRLFSPQFVNGGGFASEMNIVGLDSVPGQVTMRYFRNDGQQIGNTVVRPVAALGLIKIVGPSAFGLTQGSGSEQDPLVEGYVVIESDGPRLGGSVKFGDPAGSRFQTALPFVSTLRRSVLFSQVAQGVSGFFTGTAIINPSDMAITVLIEVFNASGVRVASGERVIPARGRVTVVLSEIDATLTLSKGYFTVTSTADFASFAVFGTGDLSVLSAIPPQLP